MTFQIPTERRDLVVMAKVAEQCERYDEMLVCMKKLVSFHPVLSLEEKNLLSVAYKNVIGARRAPWRILSTLEQKSAGETSQNQIIRDFKQRMVAEIAAVCTDIFKLLEEFLIPGAEDDESKVFYYKLKGDYHRYFVEVDKNIEQRNAAKESYANATKHASNLKESSPIRLGLALNFSVFHYEIQEEPEVGFSMAKKAFDAALPQLESLEDDDYRESATIMSLLRDNLNTWADVLGIVADDKQDDMEVEDC
jgi:14-3-3 protein epsilon